MWKVVDQLLIRAIEEDVFPGCAMAAGQGNRVLFTGVHGKVSGGDSNRVSHGTLYDVGALTRVMTTMPLILSALEKGLISLDDPITRYFEAVPSDKRDITILSLLTHTSGMAPHFYIPQFAENSKNALDVLLNHPLAGNVGNKVRDSSMGYILLGFLVEKVFSMPLDEAMKRYVSIPLKQSFTGFLPTVEDVATTENDVDTGELFAGIPQDDNARFLHGVAGHAGIFTQLEDICRYATMLAGTGTNEDGIIFSERAIHLAITERTRGMNASRGYGFRIMKRSDPFLGHLWPSDGFGLSDSASGCMLAISPEDGFFVTLLVNGHNNPQARKEMERFHKILLNTAYSVFQHVELQK